MIDISLEEPITLDKAAEYCPKRRNDRRPHPNTLLNWGRHGLAGIRLEVIRVGNTTCTSVPALQRFFNRLTEAADLCSSDCDSSVPDSDEEERLNQLGL